MCRRSEAAERLADSEKIVHVIFINGFGKPPVSIVQDISINYVEKRRRCFQFCSCRAAITLGQV